MKLKKIIMNAYDYLFILPCVILAVLVILFTPDLASKLFRKRRTK